MSPLRIAGLLAAVGTVAALALEAPEIRRYLRVKAM
jgi:hypothetical protein